ncbi:MAG: BLUF domain-containing protein [Gammaproteobacteria bacterium]|nr:BLUF domain-containing protein [Gammaproteobacteria bacterium]
MYLVRLIYVSKIANGFGADDIEHILDTARTKNKADNITGLLCFGSDIFLQCLEGSRAKVNAAYHRILNDSRHEDIVMLDYQEIIEREFSEWSMGYVPESSLTAPLNLKYSGNNVFDPYKMTGESTQRLLIELKSTIPTIGD